MQGGTRCLTLHVVTRPPPRVMEPVAVWMVFQAHEFWREVESLLRPGVECRRPVNHLRSTHELLRVA